MRTALRICKGSVKAVVPMLLVLVGMLALATPMFSQTANGRISGTVKDQTGGSIVGAAVVVTDTARGLARNLTTDDAGTYLATNLIPGNYTVRATYTGFQAWERTNIVLGVSQDLFIDVLLQPGAQTQTVTITETLPLVNSTSSQLGGTLTNQEIVDLPVMARNYINLIELLPGTVMQLGNNSGGGGPATTNGLRAESSNTYSIEGVTGIDPYTGQSAVNNIGVNGDAASLLSPDAIQEFNQQVNSKAENGSKAGSNVYVGLKSGTNAIHGTGYGYFRNDAMDALNYYNPSDSVNGVAAPMNIPVSMQQFGGTLGGPIKKDKLFFFLSYEQMRLRNGNPRSIVGFFTDPGMLNCTGAGATYACSAKTGLFPNVGGGSLVPDASNHAILACMGIPAASRSPQSLLILGMSPNCELLGGTSGSGRSFAAGQVNSDFFVDHGASDKGAQSPLNPTIDTMYPNNLTAVRSLGGLSKFDYAVNDKNSINGFMFFGHGDRFDGLGTQPGPRYETNFLQTARMYATTWTYLKSATVANAFRVGYASLDQPNYGVDVNEGFTAGQLGLNTGVIRAGQVGDPQSISLSGSYALGSRETDLQGPGRSIEINDAISYLRGTHAFKFGGSVIRDIQNISINANGRGTFTFGQAAQGNNRASGLVGLIVGQGAIPATVGGIAIRSSTTGLDSANLLFGDPYSKALRWNYSAFIQDDWRVRPRLTLNLGVRYDTSSVLTTSQKYLGTIDLTLPGGVAQEGINTPKIYNGDHNNFGPHIGFAWDMFGNGKTVLKAGGSIVYELMTLRTYLEVGNNLGLAGPPSGFVTGCSVSPNTLDTDVAAGVQLVPAGQSSNCGIASGGTYTAGLLTSAAGFTFTPATLTTPGGNRKIGNVAWSRANGNILSNVQWDYAPFAALPANQIRSSASQTIFPDPNSVNLNCNPLIQTRDTPAGTPRSGATCTGIPSIDRNFRAPYVESWTLGIQHAILNNVVLDVSYIGNHGVNLESKNNPNQPLVGSGWGLGPNGSAAGLALLNSCLSTQISGNCTNPDPAVGDKLRPLYTRFPWMGDVTNITNGDVSNYDALQWTLNVRNYHGVSLVSSYAFSHTLQMSANNNDGLGIDTYNRSLDYGTTSGSVKNKFSLSPTYNLPSVSGYHGLLDGWKLNGIFRYQSGRFLAYTQNNDSVGTGRGSNRWDISGPFSAFQTDSVQNVGFVRNPNLAQYYAGCGVTAVTDPTCTNLIFTSAANFATAAATATTNSANFNPRTGAFWTAADMAVNNPTCTAHAASMAMLRAFGCWVQGGSVLTPPAIGAFGNSGRANFTGLPVWMLDMSIAKRQKLTERFSAEVRAEFFNVFNHPIYAQPSGTIGTSCSTASCGFQTIPFTTPDVAATNPIIGTGGPRRIQLGVKVIF